MQVISVSITVVEVPQVAAAGAVSLAFAVQLDDAERNCPRRYG